MTAFMRSMAVLLVLIIGVAGVARADEYDKIAKTLAKGAKELKNKKIAVLAFPYHDGSTSSGSTEISERLTTRLVGKNGIVVIERSLLDKVFNEMNLEKSGVVDPDTTKQIGKVLGVEAIVTGTLIDLSQDKTEVNARLIKTETGEVLTACTVEVERNWKDSPRSSAATANQPAKAQPGQPVQASVDEQPPEVTNMSWDNKMNFWKQRFKNAVMQETEGSNTRRVQVIALFNMAKLFEQNNAVNKARNLYLRIIHNYPMQKDIISRAQFRLSNLR